MKKKLLLLIAMCSICAILLAATGDETVTLTSSVERRNREPFLKPVWELVVTATHDADDTGNVEQAIPINGILRKVVFVIPAFTNGSETGQVLIKDNADNTIFDSGEQADDATYTFNVDEPLTGTVDVNVGPSGAIGTNGASMVVYLRGI